MTKIETTAGHSITRMLIDGLPAQVSENVGQDPNHKTGPFYWTNAYADARACMEAVSTFICLLSDWGKSQHGERNRTMRGRLNECRMAERLVPQCRIRDGTVLYIGEWKRWSGRSGAGAPLPWTLCARAALSLESDSIFQHR